MTKVKILIDFEAISNPFTRDAKLPKLFPYAYSLGISIGKKFKCKTFVFNFNNSNLDDVYSILRKNIQSNVRQLLDNKNFMINSNTTVFIGWDPQLEFHVLHEIFPHVEIRNLNKGRNISLSRITPEIESNYFEYTKKIIAQYLKNIFVGKRLLKHNGAIAAYVGYLMHSQAHNKKGKFVAPFNLRIILKELKNYSKDDVLRMDFLQKNPELFLKRKQKATTLLANKNKVNHELSKTTKLVQNLKEYDQKQTISVLVEKLDKNIKKLEKTKTKLDDNFENF